MSEKKNIGLGCRIFVPFDEWTDLGILVPVFCKDKKVHMFSPKVMVHIEQSKEGVIFWLNMSEDDK